MRYFFKTIFVRLIKFLRVLAEGCLLALITVLTFLLMYGLISSNAEAQVQRDRLYHFGAGAGISVPSYVVGYDISKGDRKIGYLFGIGFPTAVGLLKEELDRNTTGFDNKDFKCTVLGAIVGSVVTDLLMSKKPYKTRQQKRLERIKRRDKAREKHKEIKRGREWNP